MRDPAGTPATYVPLQGDLRGSAAGDAYGEAVDALKRVCGNGGTIAITSASRGEGKSTTAANLALALAVQREPVLLADFSFPRPALEKIFGETPLPYDLAEMLRGGKPLDSIVCSRNDIGLHLAVLRRPPTFEVTPAAIEKFVDESRKEYKWVLLDCGSFSEMEQIDSVVAKADATVLVVQERKTSKKDVEEALARCKEGKVCVLLNKHR